MKNFFQMGMRQYRAGILVLILSAGFWSCATNKPAAPEPVAETPAPEPPPPAAEPAKEAEPAPEPAPAAQPEPATMSDSTLIIPEGTKVIEYQQYQRQGITEVILPGSVTTIEAYAFAFNRITRIVIPDSVEYIGKLAFYGNRIRDITIGADVEFGEFAFLNGCVVYYFIEYYEKNGRQKGRYTYSSGRWTFEPK